MRRIETPYGDPVEVELSVADNHRQIFHDTVKWPWCDSLPKVGEALLLGEDLWAVKVIGINWVMNPKRPVIVIETKVEDFRRQYDDAYMQRVLTESGLL